MSGVNKVILLGRIGKDPEYRKLEDGRSVVNFSIATNETYKNKRGEKVTNTEWHKIVAWNPFSEIIDKYVRKGDEIYIEGKLTTRSFDHDGVTKYVTEVQTRGVNLIGGSKSPTAGDITPERETNESIMNGDNSSVDELPF